MNKNVTKASLVHTNEILLNEDGKWLYFAEPQGIMAVQNLAEVVPTLHELERLVEANGWYAAGFLSYEASYAFDPALRTQTSDSFFVEHSLRSPQADNFPFLWFGLYPAPRRIEIPKAERPAEVMNWQPTIDRQSYHTAIAKIKEYIAQGRTYQVNYTMRLQADLRGDAWDFFLYLARNQNRHAAYIDTGRFVICSASPELFFQLDGETILCRPMKGTTKRGRTTLEDIQQSAWLQNSTKNLAENVMIVDMIRNDLGRIAEIGSVQVPRLFKIERYSTLWQMTSTVTAKTNASLSEIFSALFPSASITGAPKVSTMKIIGELETTSRNIYTGSIGYIAPGRRAKFNVAIRTALINRDVQSAEYGVGGGIVWDSTSMDEYREALLKARVLTESQSSFSLLETMLWTPKGGFFLYKKHLARLLDSAVYFDIPISRGRLEVYFEKICLGFNRTLRVRILLDQTGKLTFEHEPYEPEAKFEKLKVCLAKQPLDSNDVFLFHKTTRRTVYESAREGCEEFDDVLLYNELGEVTEFTIGNLVVEMDGQLFTPPISCGVLAGTFRAHLLESGEVVERTIRLDELNNCTKIFRVNSIRKWQSAELMSRESVWSYGASEI